MRETRDRRRGARRALGVLALAALVSTSAAAEPSKVRFALERKGLKFTGPCAAEFYAAGRGADRAAVVVENPEAESDVEVPPGKYEVMLVCPSTEGTYKESLALRVKGAEVVHKHTINAAFLLVDVVRNGESVKAKLKVVDARGREVAQGDAKVVMPVPPGKLWVRSTYRPKRAGRKAIHIERKVKARAGQKTTDAVDISDGIVTLKLTANRKTAEGVGVFRYPGSRDSVVEIVAGAPSEVPPGTYDVVTSLASSHDFAEVIKRKVRVESGQKLTVKVDHRVGHVSPVLTLDKAPLPEGEDVDIALYLGAALEPFNAVAPGETATLKPGAFRVRATRQGVTLDDGSPWAAEAKVKVRAGRTAQAKLDLTPARLDVTTTIGAQPAPLEVAVFLEDATAPIAKRKSDAEGKVVFALPPARYRVAVSKDVSQGTLRAETTVFLKARRTTAQALDIEAGAATVQVFDDGVAVPAEVQFFREGASAPVLTVRAGQEAWLAPGSYALLVVRRGKEYRFAPITVAAGRKAERQLELLKPDGP